MSEINDTQEVLEDIFSINFKIIDLYQRKDPSLEDIYNTGTYPKGSFCSGSNIQINIITCKDKIVIP